MTTMSESNVRLYFLFLVLLFYISPSNSLTIVDPLVGLVACHPHQIQTFTQFKSEFDTHDCDHSDKSNGIWCDNSTGAVTKLQVSGCLTGTINPNSSLFKFHHLRHLNLSFNNFISTSLPSEIGYLNKLQLLSLSSSGFLGQVPSSFNNLTQLKYLDIWGNVLIGSFPHVRNLTKLSALDLSENHLSGTLDTITGLFELHHLRFLDLGTNNFNSSLPSEIGNLYRLEVLSLANNNFLGQVPSTISNLTRLTNFYLNKNEFTGSFPLIQNLTELSLLQLAHNSLSGTIPFSLLTKSFLSHIDLCENHFTGSLEVLNSSTSSSLKTLLLGRNHFEAQILESISKLINLTKLDLSFLNTSQSIDLSHFSSFKYLLHLDLSGNNINPRSLSLNSYIPVTLQYLILESCGIRKFPNILKTLQDLKFINLGGNVIKGKIPEWLWSLSRLGTVSISGNLFNGFEGSNEVLVNSSVIALFIEYNNFEGPLPSLPLSIYAISAYGNNFTGEIPLSICNRSSLSSLVLSHNNFSGPIPQCVSNFTFVDLRKNSLEGSIPDTFCVGASLQTLDVGFNRITGKLPRSLLNCSELKFLSVDNNNIEDTFPFSLKALPNLQVMTLRSNKFHGPISTPQEGHHRFPKLRIFEIADNKFNGSLSPSYFVNWKASSTTMNEDAGLYMMYGKKLYGIQYSFVYHIDLQYKGLHMEHEQVLTLYTAIDFSGNLFEGNIPESIGLLKGLVALNLSNNAFTGHIPLSLANLQELESLDMSRNHLSGTIPNGLGSLSFLAFINVSHNQLKGEIPQGTQLTGQPKSSFEGNAGLCGLPLEKNCFETSAPQTQPHKQEDEEEEDEVLNWKGVAIGYGFGVLFGMAITQVIVSYKLEWLAKIIGMAKRRNH